MKIPGLTTLMLNLFYNDQKKQKDMNTNSKNSNTE